MISVDNITKTYTSDGAGAYQALRGVNFEIKEGEFVAIMGPSGSGKSTLMHILGALDIPTTGEYIMQGKDISSYTDDELAQVRRDKFGFVFQSFNLLPRTTVLRNVMLPLIYAGTSSEKREKLAKAALKSAGLDEEYYDHLSNQLSGGQIQRVAIARALVNSPAVIFADEPTGNLDTKTGEIVLDTFQKLNKEEGRTIIMITHEITVAEHADRIISIRDGKIESDKKNTRRVHHV